MAGDENEDDQVELRHRADAHLRAVLNNAPIVIFRVDERGRFTLSEGQGLEAAGLVPGQIVGMSAVDMYRGFPILQADGTAILGEDAIAHVLDGGTVIGLTQVGDEYYDNRFVPDRDRDGVVRGMIGISVVITQRRRAELRVAQLNRIHAMLSGINHTIVREQDPDRLLAATCRLAVDKGEFRMAWIGMVNADRRTEVAATAGTTGTYLDLAVVPATGDPTTTAALEGTRQIHNDLATTSDDRPWVRAAIAHGFRACAAFPLRVNGVTAGAFGVYASSPGFFDAEELALLEEVSDDVSFALEVQQRAEERLRMDQALRASEAQLAESEKLLRALAARLETVREQERAELAREIHDVLGQELTGIKMDIAWALRRLAHGAADTAEAVVRLQATLHEVDTTVGTVRRIATTLRPGVLDDLGLAAALEWQAKEFATRSGITVDVELPGGELQLDNGRATAVFRIFQELLTNVARHAQASRVRAVLAYVDGSVVLEVNDDGRGIAKEDLSRTTSLGLLGVRERAMAFGGSLQIAGGPARGTTARVQIPLAEPA